MLVIDRAPRQTDAPDAEYRRGHARDRDPRGGRPSDRPRAGRRVPLGRTHPCARSTAGDGLRLAATRSCARRCSGSSTSCRPAAPSTTSPRHLTGFLDEVDDRPPPLDAAMRMARQRARARRRSARAAAAGVRHMAHRFIVGETPEARSARCARCGATAWRRRSTCSARRPSPRAEAERYAAALRGRARGARRAPPRWPSRPVLERDSAGPLPRANLSRQGLRPDPAAAPRRAGAGQARRRRAPARPCCAGRASSAPTCTSTWSRWTRARRSLELVLELLAEPEFADGPSAGHRAAGLPARLARACSTILDWAARRRRAPPLACASSRAPTGTTRWSRRASTAGARRCSRTRPSATATSRRSRGGCSTRARSCASRSPRTTCARSRTRSPTTASGRAGRRPRAAGPARARRRPPGRARRAGLRVRAYCPVGDLVAGMAYLVRRLLENTANESFLARAGGAARRSRSCCRRRDAMNPFATSRARAAPRRRCARSWRRAGGLDARLPLRVPVWIGDERRDGEELVSTDPGQPDRVVATAALATAAEVDAAVAAAARGAREWARRPPASARRRWSRAAARLRERRLELAALAVRECAQAVGRGRRRRVRGDRLPRVLRARGDRARRAARRCSRCRASATRCATRRAAWPR